MSSDPLIHIHRHITHDGSHLEKWHIYMAMDSVDFSWYVLVNIPVPLSVWVIQYINNISQPKTTQMFGLFNQSHGCVMGGFFGAINHT